MKVGFSIVIPVFNNASRLREVLIALKYQSYPMDLYEIIVVDNGSVDDSARVAGSFENVIFLQEKKYWNSPYSARNRGVEEAKFETIAFLDSTCVPSKNWLLEAASSFYEDNVDLVAGNIEFEINSNATYCEIYDSLFNVNVEGAAKKGWAPCGNLFIKKELFDRFGLFAEGVRSGEDYRFTRMLTSHGFILFYNKQARVFYPTKKKEELFAKQRRIARGQVRIWGRENRIFSYFIKALFKAIIPPSPFGIYKVISKRGEPWMLKKFLGIYTIRYLICVFMFSENVKAFFPKRTV